MRSSKIAWASSLTLVIGSIVIPATRSVNQNVKASPPAAVQFADGMPLPPPPKGTSATLMADGMPLPPPPKSLDGALVADGMPLPPPPKGTGYEGSGLELSNIAQS
jgi:hypothetical protein